MENEQTTQPETYIDTQIAKLKAEGVTFDICTEREAREYLAKKCTAFKTCAYARLFDVHTDGKDEGKYIDLDFGQLKYLADIDQQLREVLLNMTLDVEHFCKTRLITECAVTEAGGHRVMREYMNSLDDEQRQYVEQEIAKHQRSPYYQSTIEQDGEVLPIWEFVEAVSFGMIISLIRYCGNRHADKKMVADYYALRSIKTLRNACAHNSCILSNLQAHGNSKRGAPHEVSKAVAALGISKRLRQRWLQTTPVAEIASLLYLYAEMVPDGSTRKRRLDSLEKLFERIEKSSVVPAENPASAALAFIKRLTSGFDLLD